MVDWALNPDKWYLAIDERGQRKVIKDIGEIVPDGFAAVLLEAFVVESINFIDLLILVVPAQDRHAIPVAQLQGEDQRHGLHAVEATVHVIAHEEVVGFLQGNFSGIYGGLMVPVACRRFGTVPTNR